MGSIPEATNHENDFSRLREGFMRACEENGVPFEAVLRLATPEGRRTLMRIIEIIRQDWSADQSASQAVGPESGRMLRLVQPTEDDGIFKIPNLSANDLFARAKHELQLTYHDPQIERWDFVAADQGRIFRRQEWRPGRKVSTHEVREHFRALDCQGNAAAFIAFVMRHRPYGRHATIPDDDRLWRHPDGKLFTICFPQEDSCRELRLGDVAVDWREYWTFVGFQAVG